MKLIILLVLVVVMLSGCWSQQRAKTSLGDTSAAEDALSRVGILPFLMVGGVVIGIFAMLNGSKIGFPAIIACLVGLTLSLAVVKYAAILAIAGMVGAVGALVMSLFKKDVGVVITTAKKLMEKASIPK